MLGYNGQGELPSISDGRTFGGFRHALQMVDVEHERELRATQVRCDIELAALRLELAEARSGRASASNALPGQEINTLNDELKHVSHNHWTQCGTPTPTESEAPSFADVRICASELDSNSARAKPPNTNSISHDTYLSPTSRSTADRNLIQGPAEMPTYSWDRARGSANHLMMANGWLKKKQDKPERRRWLAVLGYSVYFDIFCGFCILVNSTLLGIRLNEAAQSGNPEDYSEAFTVLNHVFLAWFVIELVVRFGADGKNILRSEARNWNFFDFIVVTVDLVDLIAGTKESSSPPFVVVRLLRLLRIVTSLRIFHTLGCLKMLRRMVFSLTKVFGMLLWAALLLFFLIFMFSTFLLQSATSHRFDLQRKVTLSSEELATYKDLDDMFGSLPDAWYTLYKAASGGVDWGQVGSPLIAIHWSNGVVLGLYIFFFLYVAANVLTGIVVQGALESASLDRKEVMQSQLQIATSELSVMKKLLLQHDKDGSGAISFAKLEESLQDKRVRAQLRAFGLDSAEAEGLCHLLDVDYSGMVQVEEFIHGLLRLKDASRSVDYCTVLHENKRVIEKLKQSTELQRIGMENLKSFICRSNREHLHRLATVIFEQSPQEVAASGAESPDPRIPIGLDVLSPHSPPLSPKVPMTPKEEGSAPLSPSSPPDATTM